MARRAGQPKWSWGEESLPRHQGWSCRWWSLEVPLGGVSAFPRNAGREMLSLSLVALSRKQEVQLVYRGVAVLFSGLCPVGETSV